MQISEYFSDYASIRDNYYQLLTKEYNLCNHGRAGNDFRKGDDIVYCTDDHSVKTVGSNTAAGEMSPRNMLTTTIGSHTIASHHFTCSLHL